MFAPPRGFYFALMHARSQAERGCAVDGVPFYAADAWCAFRDRRACPGLSCFPGASQAPFGKQATLEKPRHCWIIFGEAGNGPAVNGASTAVFRRPPPGAARRMPHRSVD